MRDLQGVVVDFHTLYDPITLSGAVLSYIPIYKRIYASEHSLWLVADPYIGHGWVPISGFNLLKDNFDHWGVKWLRNWCKKRLGVREDKVVLENLYASLLIIRRLMETDLLRILPNDRFMQVGGEMIKGEGFPTAILWDGGMAFQEGKENGFYLSPDLGHGFLLGAGVVIKGGDGFRFSTANPMIEEGLVHVLPTKLAKGKLELAKMELTSSIKFRSTPSVEEVFEVLEAKKGISDITEFLLKGEETEKDFVFLKQTRLGKACFDSMTNELIVNLAYMAYNIESSNKT